MKRDNNLIPLSWEHHSGLVFARRIRKKLEANESADLIRNYILGEWEDSLDRHFLLEETVISPVFLKYSQHDSEQKKMESDHNRMRKIVTDLYDGNFTTSQMLEFSELLARHIRFEEDTLFPLFESKIPAHEMDVIGAELKKRLAGEK